jgi:hypothetical protein
MLTIPPKLPQATSHQTHLALLSGSSAKLTRDCLPDRLHTRFAAGQTNRIASILYARTRHERIDDAVTAFRFQHIYLRLDDGVEYENLQRVL